MQHLTFSDLSKAYAGTPALQDVSLHLRAGEVHALMGENGAGKSTLIRLIAGVVPADSMRVEVDGAPLPLGDSTDAHRAGFRFIHQELNVVPQVSVAENVLLGRDYPRRFGLTVNWHAVNARARAALNALGAGHIDVSAMAGDLAAGDRMMMKIAAALVTEPDTAPPCLYVLDEPTAALSGAESERLFACIERLRAQGAAILYVSHRLDEVMTLCDRVTVLRDGAHVWTRPVPDTSKADIIRAMTGRAVADAYPPRPATLAKRGEAPEIVRLTGVATDDLRDLDVTLRKGEVLGVAGLAEAGQSRFLNLFMGLGRVRSGSASLLDGPLPQGPSDAWARGVACVPRERRGQGLCLDLPVRSNIVLPHLGRYGLRARAGREAREAGALAEMVRLKSAGLEQAAGELSGGNQQKVVFARALFDAPALLLLDEPTRGVDVGAKFDIYTLVRDLAARGTAVILTSSDLPEILGMCDRVLVLQEGRQAHLVDTDGRDAADLLSLLYDTQRAEAS